MKVRKIVELLKKCNPESVIKMHHRDEEELHYVDFFREINTIVLRTESDPEPVLYPKFGAAGTRITAKLLLELFTDDDMNMDIKMHTVNGRPALFIVEYENIPDVVVIEDAGDNDLSSELEARFEYAAEEQLDELDFFMDLLDTGFVLGDIKEHLPEQYEYSKMFMELHGLA